MEKEHHQLLVIEVNHKLPPLSSHNLVNTECRESQLMEYEKWNDQAFWCTYGMVGTFKKLCSIHKCRKKKINGSIATSRQSKVFVYMVILEFLTQHGIVKNNLQIMYKFKHVESNNRKATNFLWKKCEKVSR